MGPDGQEAPRPTAAASREIMPQPGTVYSMSGPNTGRAANMQNARHYPVEAICGKTADGSTCGCGQVIRSETFFDVWHHTGRMPGEPDS